MGRGTRSPGGTLYDRLLVPRIEAFAQNNDHTDEEAVVEYLRRSYKEYQRQKAGPFRLQVTRAIDIVSRRGGPAKEEVQLQVRRSTGTSPVHTARRRRARLRCSSLAQVAEGQHLRRRGASRSEGSDSDSGSSSGADDSDSSDAELDGEALAGLAGKQPTSGMNRSIISLYGGTSVADAGQGGEAAKPPPADAGDEPPAFAAPHLIAAAAARAAKEAQLAAAQDGAAAQSPARPAADGVQSDSAAAQRNVPASTSGQPEPELSGGQAPRTAAKPKRGGATPSERWGGRHTPHAAAPATLCVASATAAGQFPPACFLLLPSAGRRAASAHGRGWPGAAAPPP